MSCNSGSVENNLLARAAARIALRPCADVLRVALLQLELQVFDDPAEVFELLALVLVSLGVNHHLL